MPLLNTFLVQRFRDELTNFCTNSVHSSTRISCVFERDLCDFWCRFSKKQIVRTQVGSVIWISGNDFSRLAFSNRLVYSSKGVRSCSPIAISSASLRFKMLSSLPTALSPWSGFKVFLAYYDYFIHSNQNQSRKIARTSPIFSIDSIASVLLAIDRTTR